MTNYSVVPLSVKGRKMIDEYVQLHWMYLDNYCALPELPDRVYLIDELHWNPFMRDTIYGKCLLESKTSKCVTPWLPAGDYRTTIQGRLFLVTVPPEQKGQSQVVQYEQPTIRVRMVNEARPALELSTG